MPASVSPFLPLLRLGVDPVPELSEVRAQRSIVSLEIPGGPAAWLVTRFDDVRAVLADAQRFSNDLRHLRAEQSADIVAQWEPGGLASKDPPEHARFRRLLTAEFSARRLGQFRPRIAAIVNHFLDAMERAGPPADLVTSFASPIPSLVICELLGVPADDRADFYDIGNGRFKYSGGIANSLEAVQASLTKVQNLICQQLQRPGSGLLGKLVREHEDIGVSELVGLADGLLTGGNETTASMIALGALVLMQHRDHHAFICNDQQYLRRVVEELLRYISAAQIAFPRFAREHMSFSGCGISAGDMLLCSLPAANRDPALGSNMESFDPRRMRIPHLAFGYGMHRCIGAELAQIEMSVAYCALLRRFPGLRLAVPIEQVRFNQLSIIYGAESLPVTW